MKFAKDKTRRLIFAVKERHVIWDKRHPLSKKKDVVERQWDEVAAIAGFTKDVARDKWKNLKDAYRRQCKKVYCEAGYIPKWVYFDMLHFISPTLEKYLNENCNTSISADIEFISSNDMDSSDCNIEPEIYLDETNGSDYSGNRSIILQEPEIEILESDESNNGVAEGMSVDIIPLPYANGRVNENKVESEIDDDNDDDLHFLKSLLPYMKNLNGERKMYVRMKMQEILYKEVYATNSVSIKKI